MQCGIYLLDHRWLIYLSCALTPQWRQGPATLCYGILFPHLFSPPLGFLLPTLSFKHDFKELWFVNILNWDLPRWVGSASRSTSPQAWPNGWRFKLPCPQTDPPFPYTNHFSCVRAGFYVHSYMPHQGNLMTVLISHWLFEHLCVSTV